MTHQSKPRFFGVLGSVIGLLALVTTVAHFYFGPIAEPEPVESVIAETAVNIKKAMAAKMKGEEYVPPERTKSFNPDQALEKGVMVAALFALSLGVLGFLKKEEYIPSGLAVGLGGATVMVSISIAIAGFIVAAIIISAIIGALGLS